MEDNMETFSIILVTLISLVTLIAAIIFTRTLFPARVEKVHSALENHWKRSFWLGLANTVFITVIALGLGSLANNAPLLYVPTFTIYSAFLIGLLFGLAAFVQFLGNRLFPDHPALQKDIRAGSITLLTGLLPFVGWFLLFPYVICLSVGGVVLAIFQDRREKKENSKK